MVLQVSGGAEMFVAALAVAVNTTLNKMLLQPIRGRKVVIARLAQPVLVGIRFVEIEAET